MYQLLIKITLNLETFQYLNKYILYKKNYNILERDFKNKYTVKNKDQKPFFSDDKRSL